MKIATSTLALISLATSVHGHGYVASPPACYKENVMKTNYAARITPDINPAFANGKWNGTPQENVALFNERFPETGYKDISEVIDKEVPDCGNSLETCEVQDVSGMTEMVWQNDEEKKGIIPSHTGRCLIKIDNQVVFENANCAAEYSEFPAKFPVDYSVCPPGQKCMLKFYWWALHEVNWQLYKHCVPIKNGGGSGKQSPPSDDDADQSGKQDTPSSPSPSQSPTPNNPSTPPSSGSPSPSSPPSSGSPSPSSPPYSGSGGSAPSGSPSSSPPSSDATGNKCVRRI